MKKSKVLNMRLTPELFASITQGAALTSRSVTSFVDHAISSFLESDDFQKQAKNNVDKLANQLKA